MTQVETQAPEERQLTPLEKLRAEFTKKNRLVVMPDEDGSLFKELADTLDFVDWSLKTKDDTSFSGGALVREKEGGQLRLISFADKERAINDPVVQDWLYNRYVAAVVKSAMRADAYEDQFTVPAGPLIMVLDTEHFEERVDIWLGVILKRFDVRLKKRALAMCLEGAAFAVSQYPGIKGWDKLIGAMAKDAEDHGFSSAYYAHCLATRSISKHTGKKPIDFAAEDMDQLLAAVDAAAAKVEAAEAAEAA